MSTTFDPVTQIAVKLKEYSETVLRTLQEIIRGHEGSVDFAGASWKKGLDDILLWSNDLLQEEARTIHRMDPRFHVQLALAFENPPPITDFIHSYMKTLARMSIVRSGEYYTRENEQSRMHFHREQILVHVVRDLELRPVSSGATTTSNANGSASRRFPSTLRMRPIPELAGSLVDAGAGGELDNGEVLPDDSVSFVVAKRAERPAGSEDKAASTAESEMSFHASPSGAYGKRTGESQLSGARGMSVDLSTARPGSAATRSRRASDVVVPRPLFTGLPSD